MYFQNEMVPVSLYRLMEDPLHRLARQSQSPSDGYIRLEKECCPPVDILPLIRSVRVAEKFCFSEKHQGYTLGGLGSALVIEEKEAEAVIARLDRLWEMDEAIRVFGGMRFNPLQADAPEWEEFNHFRFTLPFVELKAAGGTLVLRVNYYNKRALPPDRIAQEIAERLRQLDRAQEDAPPGGQAAIDKEFLTPSKRKWNQMVKGALQCIQRDTLRKIVLARKKVISSHTPWAADQLLAALAAISEDSFLFFYQVDFGKAFLGRSPERLFRLEGETLLTEAIAGTRARGKNPRDDALLEAELLHSEKELDEHRIVAGFIQDQMNRRCSALQTEVRETVLKLKSIQHILTRYRGRLNQAANPLETALAFHPTPAVGGYPPDHIQTHIARSEPFARGWYAAPIGWMTRKAADFAVGIRSALVNGRELHLFAGAGIVKGSNPHAEWNETEKKMDHFTFILKGR